MTIPRAEPVGFGANRLSPAQRRTAWLPVALTAFALLAAAAAAMADEVEPAQVQPSRPFCDEPAKAIRALKDTFGEEPHAIGLDTQDRLISLFVDPADGSWTLLMTVPGQSPISCVLVGGEAWEERPLPLVGDPS